LVTQFNHEISTPLYHSVSYIQLKIWVKVNNFANFHLVSIT
jgi:hypothetical protein